MCPRPKKLRKRNSIKIAKRVRVNAVASNKCQINLGSLAMDYVNERIYDNLYGYVGRC